MAEAKCDISVEAGWTRGDAQAWRLPIACRRIQQPLQALDAGFASRVPIYLTLRAAPTSLIRYDEELLEEAFGFAQAVLGECHGFRLFDRIGDKTPCMSICWPNDQAWSKTRGGGRKESWLAPLALPLDTLNSLFTEIERCAQAGATSVPCASDQ
ncbi:hypothetical protein [Variovorax sp. HW608]|uniref:hypothetical protein n=1 Tax=Variovorax sp. HW608 TaxID=1034889 RepID=UPI0012FD5C41